LMAHATSDDTDALRAYLRAISKLPLFFGGQTREFGDGTKIRPQRIRVV